MDVYSECFEGLKNIEVTQENLYLFLPGKIANVAAIIADNDHCTMLEAMQRFYASPVYRELQQEDTKLWHLGAVALVWAYQRNLSFLRFFS